MPQATERISPLVITGLTFRMRQEIIHAEVTSHIVWQGIFWSSVDLEITNEVITEEVGKRNCLLKGAPPPLKLNYVFLTHFNNVGHTDTFCERYQVRSESNGESVNER